MIAITPEELADRHLTPYKTRGHEAIAELCPFCKGGRSGKDKHSFAMNTGTGTYNCKRGKCEASGSFYDLCIHFGEKPKTQSGYTPAKKYIPPKVEVKNTAGDAVKNYLERRKFSEKTWKSRGIFEHKGAIAIPYYENGELVLVKYREPKKKGKHWREKGGKPVFWGMDDCDPKLPLVVTEGEMDTLALDECGVKNVVSVPSGSEDLNCIEECWVWLEQFKKVIIWGDKDEAGKKMVRKMVSRIGEHRCYLVESQYKDANEHLYYEGKESTAKVVMGAKEIPIKNLLRLAEVPEFDPSKETRIRSGNKVIDKKVGGFLLGQVSVWTGENGSGKSTFIGQILIDAIDQGYGVGAYSGELPAGVYRYWTELQLAGEYCVESRWNDVIQDMDYYVSMDAKEMMRAWYFDRYFLYDSRGPSTTTDILNVFENAARRHNCKVFLVDNLMTTVFEGDERNYYRQQSEFVGRMKDFSIKHDCHVHVVAHPKKTNGKIEKMDISGSGDISNRADNVLLVERVPDEKKGGDIDYDSMVTLLKSRMTGNQNVSIRLCFSDISKRFWSPEEEEKDKVYGWLVPNKEEVTHEEDPYF